MHPRTLKALELDKVLQFFKDQAVSEGGKLFFSHLRPYLSIEEINETQNLLREFWTLFKEFSLNLNFFPNLEPLLQNLDKEVFILDLEDLWGLEHFFIEQDKVFSWLNNAEKLSLSFLKDIFQKVKEPIKLKKAIKRCLSSEGQLKDESSPALYAVRQEIREIQARCRKKVETLLKQDNLNHYLQDEYLTISSDRYVLALKSNFKGKFKGIVHDYSQSKETCYFEPYFLVELNNHLQQLRLREKEEEKKVLIYLTDLARQEKELLSASYNLVVLVDIFLAKVKVGMSLQGTPLTLSKEQTLVLKGARHPLLQLLKQKAEPVDLILKPGQKGLIITGGNAGGKTVCLKTLGLISLMVACGLPVSCLETSILPYFSRIFTVIGDEQSLEESLSTFTAQVAHLKEYLPQVNENTLVILDEFGSGTDPTQGAALAQAVIEYILEKNGWLVCATHFPGIKLYAVSSPKCRVSSVLFDPETKKPLYKLIYDQVGASYALEVARNIGLQPEVLRRAETLLGNQGQEQQVLLEQLNQLVWQKEQELRAFQQKKEKVIAKLKKAVAKLKQEKQVLALEVQKTKREIFEEWKKGKISRKLALEKLNKLSQKVKVEKKEKSKRDFKPVKDSKCLYLPWQKEAKVVEVDEKKKQCKLDLGGISLWASFEDISPVKEQSEQQVSKLTLKVSTDSVPLKLDVRGLRVEEALLEVDKYLDSALLKGVREVEIVHGKGTGALKEAIHNHLKQLPGVEKFSFAPLEAGGEGATWVRLKA